MADQFESSEAVLKEAATDSDSDGRGAEAGETDLSLLEESLRLTP